MLTLRQKIFLFLFPLLLSLPFLNRATFVDDNYFIEIAQWLVDHPDQPYHFRADDNGLQTRGWEEDGFVRMVNPLAHHYFLAILIKLGGTKEWFLRLGSVLLSCFSALFLFELARRWTKNPLLSTLIVLATPVHWLTAHSLLIDSTLSFFFLSALYFFLRGMEKESLKWLVVSGILMGLCILTKYPGIFIIPLTGLWWVLKFKKLKRPALYFIPWIIGVLFLLGYSAWTHQLYGEPHILAASKRMVHVFGWVKPLIFFIFFSGVTLVPLLSWPQLGHKRILFAGLGVWIFMLIFSGKMGGYGMGQSFLMGLWMITSFLFLFLMWDMHKKLIYPRDFFLVGWVLGFIVMMYIVMLWVAARYFMIVVPAVVFLSIRFAEIKWKGQSDRWLRGTLACLLILGSMLAYADYQQAEPARDLSRQFEKMPIKKSINRYYIGDSFTLSYLKKAGWTPAFTHTEFSVGDHVLVKEVASPPYWNWHQGHRLIPIAVFSYPTRWPIKVMHNRGSAGFYASVWGALPFTFAKGPWERFRVFEIGPKQK